MYGNDLDEGLEGSLFRYGKWQKVREKSWKIQGILSWRLRGNTAKSESSLGTCHFVGFVELPLKNEHIITAFAVHSG